VRLGGSVGGATTSSRASPWGESPSHVCTPHAASSTTSSAFTFGTGDNRGGRDALFAISFSGERLLDDSFENEFKGVGGGVDEWRRRRGGGSVGGEDEFDALCAARTLSPAPKSSQASAVSGICDPTSTSHKLQTTGAASNKEPGVSHIILT